MNYFCIRKCSSSIRTHSTQSKPPHVLFISSSINQRVFISFAVYGCLNLGLDFLSIQVVFKFDRAISVWFVLLIQEIDMICFEILPRNRISDLFIELEIFNHTQFPEIIHSISQNNFEVNKNYICIIIRRQSEVCNVSYEYLRSKFIRLIKKIRMEVCLSRETVFQYIKNNT